MGTPDKGSFSLMLGRDRSTISPLGLYWYLPVWMVVLLCYCFLHGSTDEVSSLTLSSGESPHFLLSLPLSPPQWGWEGASLFHGSNGSSHSPYGSSDTVWKRGFFIIWYSWKCWHPSELSLTPNQQGVKVRVRVPPTEWCNLSFWLSLCWC